MTLRTSAPSRIGQRVARRTRRGSALVLVLVMTLSMAGLAVSAVLLSSSSSLIQRYYDKDKDFRLYARAALGLVKSQAQRDTTFTLISDTAYQALTASTVTDAAGNSSAPIRVNAYAAYTGDTAGTHIPFLTILAQAYDTLGVRSVQRLDMRSESFSRYALLVDTFMTGGALPSALHIRGRVHGNRNWVSASSPGTTYYDTLSAVNSTSGTANLSNTVAVTGVRRIKWPTATSVSNLGTLGTAGSLSFSAVASSDAPGWPTYQGYSGGQYVSGDASNSAFSARRGTRLRFRTVDVDNDGVIDADEGFVMVFNLSAGMDTANLRADHNSATTETLRPTSCNTGNACRSTILMNNCGLMITRSSGRREFFPLVRFREQWVRQYVRDNSVAPLVTDADTLRMASAISSPNHEVDTASATRVLSYGIGYSRCFPSGSPYLMLSERYETAACVMDSTVNNFPYAWGGPGGCTAHRYGGQDTTFTPNASRCYIRGTGGQCYDNGSGYGLKRVGAWQAFGGTSTANPPASVLQAVETAYLWPLSTSYNAASRGVIYSSSTNPLYVSDTVRGFVTLYAKGRVVLVDDLVYDQDPTASGNLCRNLLGIVSDSSIKVASSPINFPRRTPDANATPVYAQMGTPHFNLHGIAMSISPSLSSTLTRRGIVGIEDSTTDGVGGLTCNGTSSSGGCLNHTGGAIMKVWQGTTGGAGQGLIRNLTPDPCTQQQTNRRPPFFPLTGKFIDYRWSDADTRENDTWTEIKAYYARLRGNNRAVP